MDRNKEMAVIHEYISRLGMVVQKERVAKNLTLDEIAFRSNISSYYMKRIIAGKANPTITILVKLSHGLELTLSMLIMKVEENMKEG